MAAKQGSAHHKAKLTEDDVRDIRSRYAAGGVSYMDLAVEYGLPQSNIGYIVKRQTWRHVE